jgi:hypothetical protein
LRSVRSVFRDFFAAQVVLLQEINQGIRCSESRGSEPRIRNWVSGVCFLIENITSIFVDCTWPQNHGVKSMVAGIESTG